MDSSQIGENSKPRDSRPIWPQGHRSNSPREISRRLCLVGAGRTELARAMSRRNRILGAGPAFVKGQLAAIAGWTRRLTAIASAISAWRHKQEG